MSDNVTDIDDQRPHAMIVGPSGDPHVIPIEAIRRMSNGKNKLITRGQEDVDIDLIQGLIADWLILNGY